MQKEVEKKNMCLVQINFVVVGLKQKCLGFPLDVKIIFRNCEFD